MKHSRETRTAVLCGLAASLALVIGQPAIYGQVPDANKVQQEARTDNASLLAQPQFTETLNSLEKRFKYYSRPQSLADTYPEQCQVDAMLFLQHMKTSPQTRPPYMYSLVVSADRVRSLQMQWIGMGRSVPAFEVIGRGGRVVGRFEGVEKFSDSYGGDLRTWFRILVLFPILKGEKDIGANFFDNSFGMQIRLEVDSLREIEGIKLISKDGSLPRFVQAEFGDSVFAGDAEPPAVLQRPDPSQPQGPLPRAVPRPSK